MHNGDYSMKKSEDKELMGELSYSQNHVLL